MKRENGSSIFLCLFEVVVGILLLINPVSFTSGIIIAAGIALLCIGLTSIIKYFKADAEEAALSQSLLQGLVALLAGGFCAFNSHWFVVTFPVLTIIYGIVILVTGLGKVQMAVDLLRAKRKKWFIAAISAVISIACGVVILNSPFSSTAILWVFTGISLIVEAVVDIVALIFNMKDKGVDEE